MKADERCTIGSFVSMLEIRKKLDVASFVSTGPKEKIHQQDLKKKWDR
jgi:hypothetical protein